MKTYLINAAGTVELASSLKHLCNIDLNPANIDERTRLYAWAADAESDMDNGCPQGLVELPARYTLSGRTETITLGPEHFDVRETADEE